MNSSQRELAVAYLPIGSLRTFERNSRVHSVEQVAQIAASIKEFGFTNPILIDETNEIIAGHGRLEAAQLIGMDHVPCIMLDDLSIAQKRKLVIADNRLAINASWDCDVLAVELDELRELGEDLTILGFDADELNNLIGTPRLGPKPEKEKDDEDDPTVRRVEFKLHEDQKLEIERAIELACTMGPFIDTGNDSQAGNALARICETFITQNGEIL